MLKLLRNSLLAATLILLSSGFYSGKSAKVQAQSTNVGTSTAQFLKINAGARAEAMGGAFVGITDDALAMFWNPAGIAHINQASVMFTNIPWWADIEVNQFAGAVSFEGIGTFGVSVMALSVPEQEIRTVDQPDGTGRFFDAGDLMIGVSYARHLLPQFSVGITAKYVTQRIWNERASGLAFDIGTQYNFGFRNLTLGMAVHNFGADMRFEGSDLARFIPPSNDPSEPPSRRPLTNLETLGFPLPLHFQVGAVIDAVNTSYLRWIVAADLKNPSDNYEMLSLGSEAEIKMDFASVFARGGYTFNNPDQKWSVGGGLLIDLSGYDVLVDYSWSEHEFLPGIRRLSVSLSF
ncbi:MAG: PorV/PorQ family protein [Balneolales bacterium]|nr:PorV/PorQ family protein [Balneolales bacterium]